MGRFIALASKLDGYRRRAIYEWNQLRWQAAASKRERVFSIWLAELAANPPEVMVGANLASFGGVRHHIQAIQRYSSKNVALVPNEKVISVVGAHHLANEFDDRFSSFPASGVKVAHSHVFPWFIKWCQLRQKNGMRWVHTYHLNYFPEHGVGELDPWQADINRALINNARHADVRLSVSKWQVEALRREHGIETQYLPNGVDVELCDQADATRFIRKTGFEDFVLWVGRNDPVKNPVEFVRLAKRMPEQQFVMIGGGISPDSLRDCWNVELPRNIGALGPLTHSEVQDAIAASSVLVVTSKREGLPTLVMEGMAQRKPVVVPDEAGCVEVIGDGEFGLIYESNNVDDLLEKTLQAQKDSEIGSLSRERVLSEYDWRVVARNLDRIYTEEIE